MSNDLIIPKAELAEAEQAAALANMAACPEVCYSRLLMDNSVVVLRRGVSGYAQPTSDPNDYLQGANTAEAIDKVVDRLNYLIKVTPADRRAMEFGAQFGWHVPGAHPSLHSDLNKIPMPEDIDLVGVSQTWTLLIDLTVANGWIRDGFDLTQSDEVAYRARIIEFLEEEFIGLAHAGEVKAEVNVTRGPARALVSLLQNTETDDEVRAAYRP